MRVNSFLLVVLSGLFSTLYAMDSKKEIELTQPRQIVSLKMLAARKIAQAMDPLNDYRKAKMVLGSNGSIPPDVLQLISQGLAFQAEERLEPLLNSQSTRPFNKSNEELTHNLFEGANGGEERFGIYDDKVFIPPLLENVNLKYRKAILSPDKTMCVTQHHVIDNTSLDVWDCRTGKKIKNIGIKPGPGEFLTFDCVGISSDNAIVAANFYSSRLNHYNCFLINIISNEIDIAGNSRYGVCNHTGTQLGKFLQGTCIVEDFMGQLLFKVPLKFAFLDCFRFAPADDYFIACQTDAITAQIRESNQGDLKFNLKHEAPISDCRISSDGLCVATYDSKTLNVWDPYSGQLVAVIPHNYDRHLHYGEFFCNNEKLVTYSTNPTDDPIQIWDIKKRCLIATRKPLSANKVPKDMWYIYSLSVLDDTLIVDGGHELGKHVIKLSSALGKELTLKELVALLILEYNKKNEMSAYLPALDILQQSQHTLLQQLIKEGNYSNYKIKKTKKDDEFNFCQIQ